MKSVLLYKCRASVVSKVDQRKPNSSHRRQLGKVIAIQWPHKISKNKLYKITGTKSMSIAITETRWKLLGTSTNCQPTVLQERRWGTIWREDQQDLQRKKKNHHSKHPEYRHPANKSRWHHLPSNTLVSKVSLQNLYTKAKNRKLWSNIVQKVVKLVYSRLSKWGMPHSHRKEKRLRKNKIKK